MKSSIWLYEYNDSNHNHLEYGNAKIKYGTNINLSVYRAFLTPRPLVGACREVSRNLIFCDTPLQVAIAL